MRNMISKKVFDGIAYKKGISEKPVVVVLEDEVSCMEPLMQSLSEQFDWDFVPINTFRQFVYYSRSHMYDAISIDWKLGKAHKGQEVFDQIFSDEQVCGKLVFTQHEHIFPAANEVGADSIIKKVVEPDTKACTIASEYLNNMECVYQLGTMRQIISHLDLKEFQHVYLYDAKEKDRVSNAMNAIIDHGRTVAINTRRKGNYDYILECILSKMNAFELIDKMKFAGMNFIEKISFVLNSLHINCDELSRMLRVDTKLTSAFISSQCIPNDYILPIYKSMDGLLSIFSYLLSISNYKLEIVLDYWMNSTSYSNCNNRPPWSPNSIRDYIFSNSSGIDECVMWIRSI